MTALPKGGKDSFIDFRGNNVVRGGMAMQALAHQYYNPQEKCNNSTRHMANKQREEYLRFQHDEPTQKSILSTLIYKLNHRKALLNVKSQKYIHKDILLWIKKVKQNKSDFSNFQGKRSKLNYIFQVSNFSLSANLHQFLLNMPTWISLDITRN